MKIKMTLKSDSLPGSGNSLAGIIDRDVVYDENGFPYIPAKRIKGVLRESAEELRMDGKTIDILFGKEGEEKSCGFIIDNGFLKNYLQLNAFFENKDIKEFLPSQSVLDYYTYTRSQTTIENRIAKEDSLRISRVLKKGLVFLFHVEFPDEYIEEIRRICKITRSFGSSRTRGFGEIEMELIGSTDVEKHNQTVCSGNDDTNSSMKLTVYNQSQLLVSSCPGESQISDDYINGPVILGMAASNYIRQNGVDEGFNELFLSGKVSFGNLYPCPKNGKKSCQYYPAPQSVKKVKSDPKNFMNGGIYANHAILDDMDDKRILEDVIFKGGINGFVTKDLEYSITVKKNVEYHHRRSFDRGIAKANENEGDFFQFEVIEPNQAFSGEIVGPKNLLEKVRKCFPGNNYIRLGKSKASQYGKCKFKLEDIQEFKDEIFEWEAGESAIITLLSDMILMNENGFYEPNGNLFVKEIANKIEVDETRIKLIKSIVKTGVCGGFMGVWKLPKIQKNAIKAGSVFVLKNNTGSLIEIKNPESLFFGNYFEEGFGRVMISDLDEDKKKIPELQKEEEKKSNTIDIQLEETKELILFQWMKLIKGELLKESIKKANQEEKINSFLGKINGMLKNSNSFEEFESKLKKLNSKKQESNLRKIKDKMILNEHYQIDWGEFEKIICKPQRSIPEEIKKRFPIALKDKEKFEFYQFYGMNYLANQKYKNRGGKK